jgi:hypothetical protein
MDKFFTWDTLATLAGATAAVALITQFIKNIPFLAKIPTQVVSYILACLILAAATLFTGMSGASVWAIIPLNAVIVSTSANGAYAAILRAKNGTDKTE